MADNPTDDRPTIQATATSFTIIEALRQLDCAGVTEIASHTDLPKSTVYKHLITLEDIGYVSSQGNVSQYELGLPFVSIGQHVHERNELFTLITPEIEKLGSSTEGVAGLFVERGNRGFDVFQSEDIVNLNDQSTYLHCSAPGKAILAEMARERRTRIVEEGDLLALTENTITDKEVLFDELNRIRERGIAFDREEQHLGHKGIAVPVTVDEDGIFGAVYVVGNSEQLAGKRFEEHIPGMIISCINRIRAAIRETETDR